MRTVRSLRRDIGLSAWNAKNASERRLRRFVRSRVRRGDVVIVLTEVWLRHDELRRIAARYGLQLLAETPEPNGRAGRVVSEHGDTVMLLAPDFELESWDVVELSEQWLVASANRVHDGRRLIRAIGSVDGQRLKILGVHGPTDIEANEHAVAEFETTVARILRRTRPGTIAAAVGDVNRRRDEVLAWARAIGARVSGHGPDLVIALGAFVTSRKRGRRGSDHYAMAHKLSRRQPRRRRTRRKENP